MTLEGSFDRVLDRVKEAFDKGDQRWTLNKVSAEDQRLTGTVETAFFGFIDDFNVKIKKVNPDNDNWKIVAESSSRIGRGDFGQNARNIRNFYRRLRDLPLED